MTSSSRWAYEFLCHHCQKFFDKILALADYEEGEILCPHCGSKNVEQRWAFHASDIRADPEIVAKRLLEVDATERKFRLQPPHNVLEQIREPWPSEIMVRASGCPPG